MTYHVVCHDCPHAETLVNEEAEAVRARDRHEWATSGLHDVEYQQVDTKRRVSA